MYAYSISMSRSFSSTHLPKVTPPRQQRFRSESPSPPLSTNLGHESQLCLDCLPLSLLPEVFTMGELRGYVGNAEKPDLMLSAGALSTLLEAVPATGSEAP